MSEEKKSGGIASFGIGFASDVARAPAEQPPEQERPLLRIVVLSELAPRADHALRPAPGSPVAITRGAIDEAVAEIAPSFSIEVPDPLVAGKSQRVDVRVDGLSSFKPAGLATGADATAALLRVREALRAVSEGKLSPAEARARALAAAEPRGWADAIAAILPGGAPAPSQATAAPARSAIDDLLDKVDFAPSPAEAPSAIAAFARATSESRPSGPVAGLDAVERALTELLSSILAHPETRRLERAWLGLALLAARATDGVDLRAIAVGPADVEDALAALAEARDALAVDLLVIDAETKPTPADLDRLERWAAQAAAIGAPLVTEGSASLLGVDSIADLGRTRSRLRASEDPRAIAVRAVSARDAARSVMLVANQVVLRAPRATRVEGLRFEQTDVLLGSPVHVVAALAAERFAKSGWPTPITGPRNGTIAGLPLQEIDDGGRAVATPLEGLVSIEAQDEAARAGLAVLVGAHDRDTATLVSAPMLHRGPKAAAGGDPSSTTTLADALLVSKIARVLEAIASAIPAGTPKGATTDVVRLAFAEVFGATDGAPSVDVDADEARVAITVRPRGFGGAELQELSLSARLG